MAAAKVDINVDQDATWEMVLGFWDNQDRTIPIDISGWVFDGTFNFTDLCIPITFTTVDNSVTCRIEATALSVLPSRGTYAINVTDNGTKERFQQGEITVDKDSTCT